MTKPLAGYIRVSRKGDREELRSPDFQRQAITRYADAEGLQIEFSEPEIDVSGSKDKRPILDGIVARVKAGELRGLVVAKLDRLSRMSPKDRVLLFEQIEDAGGIVLSASEQLDPSTPEGRFSREVFLGIARMQWEKYRQGFEDAKEGAIERGIPVNSRAAVGYCKRDTDRRLEIDPATAPIVREVFERRARGEGPTALGDLLERAGVPTSQGSTTWSKPAVYGLLSNRVYLGELSYGLDRRYVKADAHEPIVDLALWTAAQHPNGRRLPPVGATSEWLLTGLARCATCRYCLQGTTTSRGKRIYRCTRKHAGGTCPAPARIDADTLERAAVDAFWKATTDLEARGTVEHVDLSDLEADVERASAGLRAYMTPEVQEAIGDPALWTAGLRERREARDTAAGLLGQARAAIPADDVPDVDTLRAAWERMSTGERRELLGLRFDAFAVERDPYRLRAFPAGTAPRDLPRRGYKAAPVLAPFAPSTGLAVAPLGGTVHQTA